MVGLVGPPSGRIVDFHVVRSCATKCHPSRPYRSACTGVGAGRCTPRTLAFLALRYGCQRTPENGAAGLLIFSRFVSVLTHPPPPPPPPPFHTPGLFVQPLASVCRSLRRRSRTLRTPFRDPTPPGHPTTQSPSHTMSRSASGKEKVSPSPTDVYFYSFPLFIFSCGYRLIPPSPAKPVRPHFSGARHACLATQ